jgi:hypothetical protein
MKQLIFAIVFLLSGVVARAQAGGMYMPTVTGAVNASVFSADSAHYMTAGNQCYVYGRFLIGSTNTDGTVTVTISTPLPLAYNVRRTSAGNNFTFSPGSAPIIGVNFSTFNGVIQLSYDAVQTGFQTVYYFFTFTTKQL